MTGFRYLERAVVTVANPTLAPEAVPAKRRHESTPARAAQLRRLIELAAQEKRSRTHCPAGHEYAGANLYVTPDGKRKCRRCRNNQAILCRMRKRLAAL